MADCRHVWTMINVRSGYLVVEGCYKCEARSSFFSTEPVPPVDNYHDGEHFWKHLGSSQAVKFDLECRNCGKIVSLDDMMGIMLSTCRDPECEVHRLSAQRGNGTFIYVAFCADSTHPDGRCVSDEGIGALTEYFNNNIKDPDKKIVVVPCKMCCSLDTCEGIVIADTDLTEFY